MTGGGIKADPDPEAGAEIELKGMDDLIMTAGREEKKGLNTIGGTRRLDDMIMTAGANGHDHGIGRRIQSLH